MRIISNILDLARCALSNNMTRQNPIVFVIGCTGTGKSDLGVALAKKWNGEVISCDSMQIYRGLDIATNKVTLEEADGIPHHLMSFLDPSTSNFNVHDFCRLALDEIEAIRSRGRIPIIVGGTTYYVESLLFRDIFINTEEPQPGCNEDLDLMENVHLHKLLEEVDPESARLIHPNNRARVRRAIEIFRLTGKKKSDFVKEQREVAGNELGGRLRFENSLGQRSRAYWQGPKVGESSAGVSSLIFIDIQILSLDASIDVLDERLNKRVQKMETGGLRRELEDFYAKHGDSLANKTHGILQCIGFKEFLPYLRLKPQDRTSESGNKLFKECCESVKTHTRQYSRTQRRWVNSRLLKRRRDSQLPSFQVINTSDKDTFISEGIRIVDEWMNGSNFYAKTNEDGVSADQSNLLLRCDDCSVTLTGKQQWEAHIKGKRHRSLLHKRRDSSPITKKQKKESQAPK